MKIAEQIRIITDILNSFNPAKESINTHALSILSLTKHEVLIDADDEESGFTKNAITAKLSQTALKSVAIISEGEHEFILKTTCDIVEYSGLFNALIDLLYGENENLNPAYKVPYKIFFHFVFFELSSGNFKKLKFMLEILNSTAILPFLRLIFEKATFGHSVEVNSTTKLAQTARIEAVESRFYLQLEMVLLMFFSEDHLKKTVERVLDFNYENALQMIAALSKIFEYSDDREREDESIKKATELQDFNITAPTAEVKPKVLFIEHTYKAEKYESDGKTIEQVLQERDNVIKEAALPPTIPDASSDKFVKPPKRPSKTSSAEEPLRTYKAARPPQLTVAPKVTATKAEILRENKLLEEKKKEAAEELEKYAKGLHDSYEYDSWREAMINKDEMEKDIEVEQNKLNAKLSLDMAKNSRVLDQEKRKAVVTQLSVEQMEEMLQKYEEQEVRNEELINQAENIKIETQEAVIEAKSSLLENKHETKEEVQEQENELLEEAKDEQLMEQLEKIDLVEQIKAILQVSAAERFIKIAEKYDPAETENMGLLNEMSLVELRERLSEIKKMKQELEEEKRDAISRQKQADAEELREKAEEVERVKEAVNEARKEKFTVTSSKTYQRTLKEATNNSEMVKEALDQEAKQETKRLQSQIQGARDISRDNSEKLQELKAKMGAIKQNEPLAQTFQANRFIPPKQVMPDQKMREKANEMDVNARKQYNERLKREKEEKVEQMLEANTERKKMAQEIEAEEEQERRALVLSEKAKQKEQERKLVLENMYKAKAMGKEIDEVYL